MVNLMDKYRFSPEQRQKTTERAIRFITAVKKLQYTLINGKTRQYFDPVKELKRGDKFKQINGHWNPKAAVWTVKDIKFFSYSIEIEAHSSRSGQIRKLKFETDDKVKRVTE